MMFTPAVKSLIDIALSEDMPYGDLTSENLFNAEQAIKALINAREPLVVFGLEIAQEIFRRIDSSLICTLAVKEGDSVFANTPLMMIEGEVCSILKGERLALNFVQHLSGIATLTNHFVRAISPSKTKITHTRKTTPGFRNLEIQAVLHGGGTRHRSSLSQAVLIKDNHIKACGNIRSAVDKIRKNIGHTVKIEVECDKLEQVEEALSAGVEIILMDNMDVNTLKLAVQKINNMAITEASGGITLKNIKEIAQTGVDYISTSEITLSAPAVDIGLDFL